jgi:NADH-quinone oxidoreductase subunit J
MLTSLISARGVRIMNEQVGSSALVVIIIFGLMTFASLRGIVFVGPPPAPGYVTASLGRLLMTTYVLPFEAVSILLLAAMVGAIILARREREKD